MPECGYGKGCRDGTLLGHNSVVEDTFYKRIVIGSIPIAPIKNTKAPKNILTYGKPYYIIYT